MAARRFIMTSVRALVLALAQSAGITPTSPALNPRAMLGFAAVVIAGLLLLLYFYRRRLFILFWISGWMLIALSMFLARPYPIPQLTWMAYGIAQFLEILGALGPRPAAAQLLEQVRAEAETTPDDMAACMLAPPEVGGGSYTHVEELEVDARALSGGRVEGFLEECQLPAAAIARALQRAREVVAEFDTAVLTVELAPTRAATVIPGESVTRGAALPQPQQSAAPLLQALPAT